MNRLLITLAAAAIAAAPPVHAQQKDAGPYPSKPIRIFVPSTPGGPPDLVARLIGDKLAGALGQPLIVENRPGIGGTIALAAVAKAAPDGYTLGIMGLPTVVAPRLTGKLPYDTEKDLAAVTLVNWTYALVAVPAASPARSVADLVALAKAKPDALKFSSGGNGTPAHLGAEMLKHQTGVSLVHIPYKGAPAAVAALVAGDVDLMIASTGPVSPQVKAGKLRVLATPAPHRIAAYPDLPTMIELGYPGVELRDWQGVVAPAGTPREVIGRLHAEIVKVLAMPEIRQRLEAMGMEPAGAGPDEFQAHIRSELQKWGKVVRDAGITAD